MASARQNADGAKAEATKALADGRHRAVGGSGPAHGGRASAVLALQRDAGNSAVSALMMARLRSPGGEAVADIDGALKEIKKDEPVIETVDKGMKHAEAAGIPVEKEAPKPPAEALAVHKTGFGPGSVAPKKPVPPTKPVPAVPAAAKAAAAKPKIAGGAPMAKAGPTPAGGGGGGTAAAAAPVPMTADMLLQPPVAPTGTRPDEDPAFAQVTGNVKGFAKAKKAHPPASSKAKEAQGAALAPADDMAGQAKAAKADTMDAQQAGSFDKKAFIAAVKTAIEAKAPKTLKEATDPKASKVGEVKGEVKGMVSEGKDGASQAIESATDAPPDQSKAIAKPVTPMVQEDPGAAVQIPAAGAVPKPAPAEQTNLEAGKHEANQEMADANVTDEQLAKSNEPEFQGALADKQKAAEHADTAPAAYREQEQATLAQGKQQADAEAKTGVAGMQGAKGAALAKLVAAKGKTKSKDEQKRAEVTAKIQSIFTATEADVKKTLNGIDPQVDKAFETGEKQAKQAFESYVAAKMSAYKEDRYSGWRGKLRWVRDKFKGMPPKVNEFYVAGRELYLQHMDGVIAGVADIVGRELTAAKQRIAQGKNEISAYVKTLPKDLAKVGSEAAKDIGDKFEQLESDVNDKQSEVVETLATKYVESRKALDERIEELQAENRGLIDKAIGAIKAVINTIRELVAMLKNTLARAAAAIGDIIKDPIGFLGNLIGAIKGGINKFFANIGVHLKKGLMGWLFGQLGDAGIEIPDTFDIKGIIKLLASIFGLTWANIRNRIVKQIGEKAMAAIEKGVDIFQKIASGGIGAVWEMLMEKLGDIKAMIMEQIQDFVITKIITAGITWLISLLNPAAAFIKACKLIYDVVMFFVNNAARIMKFVNTVIDGVVDIAKGNVSSVVDKIEDALGQMVPILIGFIASVLGIGGIGEKIRSIITAIQKPFNKAIDFVIKQGLKIAGPVIRGLKGIGSKVKGKIDKGKAYVKGKVDSGKKWVKGKAVALGEKLGIIKQPVKLPEKERTLSANMNTGLVVLRTASGSAPDAESRTAISKEEEEIRHLTRTGSAARSPVANHLRRIGDMLVEAHRRVAGGRTATPPAAAGAAAALTPQQQRIQEALADPVRKHSTNSRRGTSVALRTATPHEQHLESEHVIPVSWVSIALRLLGRSAIDRQGGFLDQRDDKSMSTVLMYKQASDVKTGQEGPIYGELEAIVDQTLPPALQPTGRSREAREFRRTTRGRAARDAARADWQQRLGQVRERLLDNLHQRLAESEARTQRVVVADHTAAKHAVRGHTGPLPQPGHINTAATQQLQQIARILSKRVEDMYPAESAFAEAEHKENVREDLRKGGAGKGEGYKQRPSGVWVPGTMADDE